MTIQQEQVTVTFREVLGKGRALPVTPQRFWQRVRNWFRPAAPWVALLGVDGSGKSTVLSCLASSLPPAFTGLYVLHRRPHLVYPSAAAHSSGSVQHYAKPPHNALLSVLKLVFIGLDWFLGYFWHIRGRQANGVLVVADRHALFDLLTDPLRYRYGGPQWPVWAMLRLLPVPDLVILLDAPVDVLQARKTELTPENAAALRSLYLQLIQQLPSSVVIDASQPLPQVVTELAHVIAALAALPHSDTA